MKYSFVFAIWDYRGPRKESNAHVGYWHHFRDHPLLRHRRSLCPGMQLV